MAPPASAPAVDGNPPGLMDAVGYHASHEQYAPSALLEWVEAAEAHGLRHAMCSDHFMPFSEAQGHSGFAWSWLGAALARTSMSFGTVTAPGQRYHPAVLAQAIATLGELFPGRFWVALASGENLNEHITGDVWPPKLQRQRRLRECVDVIRALLAGERVTHHGLVHVSDAKLYCLPPEPPPLLGAAVSPESAAWVGTWADGLVTVNQPRERLRQVVEAFRAKAGADKPMYLQVHLSLAATEGEALEVAHAAWKTGALSGDLLWDAPSPAHVDAAARFVRPDDMRESVRISSALDDQLAWLREDRALGFERVYLHQVGPQHQRGLLEALAKASADR